MLNGICKLLLLATIVMEGTCALHNCRQNPIKSPAAGRAASGRLAFPYDFEEKVGQLLCPLGWEMYGIEGEAVFPSDKFKQLIKERHAGMLWATYRADPWTRKTLENGLNPALAAKAGNSLQKYVMENTRLGIPLFWQKKRRMVIWQSGQLSFLRGSEWLPPGHLN